MKHTWLRFFLIVLTAWGLPACAQDIEEDDVTAPNLIIDFIPVGGGQNYIFDTPSNFDRPLSIIVNGVSMPETHDFNEALQLTVEPGETIVRVASASITHGEGTFSVSEDNVTHGNIEIFVEAFHLEEPLNLDLEILGVDSTGRVLRDGPFTLILRDESGVKIKLKDGFNILIEGIDVGSFHDEIGGRAGGPILFAKNDFHSNEAGSIIANDPIMLFDRIISELGPGDFQISISGLDQKNNLPVDGLWLLRLADQN